MESVLRHVGLTRFRRRLTHPNFWVKVARGFELFPSMLLLTRELPRPSTVSFPVDTPTNTPIALHSAAARPHLVRPPSHAVCF